MSDKSFKDELKEISLNSIENTVSMLYDKIKNILRDESKRCSREVIIPIYPLVSFDMTTEMSDKIISRITELLSLDRITSIPYYLNCYIKVLM